MSKLWTFEGDLYSEKLGYKTPLRKDFNKTFGEIDNTTKFKATLRHGAFTDLGGYPLFFITSDCAPLCFKCAHKEFRNIIDSIRNRANDGWRIITRAINYEDTELYCDHCSEPIKLAYGEKE